MPKTIVITDLDGTLLDEKYSFEAAAPALGLLREKSVPVVVCSSKTRPEIELYRQKMGLKDPFIVENGGAVFIPAGYFGFAAEEEAGDGYQTVELGKRYSEIRGALQRVIRDTGIKARGFGDMSAEEVASLAGLTLPEAVLARQREFDEPFVFGEGETGVQRFLEAIAAEGFKWTRGAFYHILGDNDKGKAARLLKGYYEKEHGRVSVIALGDSLNDLPLLEEADFPVLVRKKDGGYEAGVDLPGLMRTEGVGPEGWKEAIFALRTKL